MFLKKRTSSVHLRFQTTLLVTIPWSQRLSFNIIFFLFGNLRREALMETSSREERKPLVKIVENLTFMLLST